MSVPFALSFYDLAQVDGFNQALKDQNKPAINDILYRSGMCVDLGYDIVSCTHRVLTRKEPWTGPRFEGYERTDHAYIATGAASLDAYIASCDDASLRVDLKMHSRTSCDKSTEDMLERAAHSEARKVSKQLSKEG